MNYAVRTVLGTIVRLLVQVTVATVYRTEYAVQVIYEYGRAIRLGYTCTVRTVPVRVPYVLVQGY